MGSPLKIGTLKTNADVPPKKKDSRVIKNVEVFKNGYFLMG